MLANRELREIIKRSEVYMYQIAEALGIHENTLYRMLRKELTLEQKTELKKMLKQLQSKVGEKNEMKEGEINEF
ncbi:hypothetical protein V7148_20525 [Gottfriedia acidiceleris]|uniref:hypothetical protein n=1 Tax=Gottfriedia acidiceleris TaxID=371036 RepID=UPI002FFE8B7C